MNIVSSKPVPIVDAHEILSKRKEDGELGYEQGQALDHSTKYSKLTPAQVAKLIDTITENKKISRELAISIIDISPSNPSTLKAILVKDKVDLSDEEIAKVLKELA